MGGSDEVFGQVESGDSTCYPEEAFSNSRSTTKAIIRKAKAAYKAKQRQIEEEDVPVVSQERVMAIISGKEEEERTRERRHFITVPQVSPRVLRAYQDNRFVV